MHIIEKPLEMRALAFQWHCAEQTIGFVPTMGALHAGHLALVEAARRENTKVVASIFVNPTQFGPNEDYTSYPRPFEKDCKALEEAGCDALFAPSPADMYGEGNARRPHTLVDVTLLGDVWEGMARPGHLRGVATVVAKLFNITLPDKAYFGEKDYQQLKVIEQMARDLNFPLEIVPIPTVRATDGLALSSRNARLSPEERKAALCLHDALCRAVDLREKGETAVPILGKAMQEICDRQPTVRLQYIGIVDAATLSPLDQLDGRPVRILIAAQVGTTRLIDNIALSG